jgi:hypothetical protein
MLPCKLGCTEDRACRGGNARRAARFFARVLRFRISVTAVKRRVSASDADDGSRPSASATPTTETTRHGASALGGNAIANTGRTIASRTRDMVSKTVPNSVNATAAGGEVFLQMGTPARVIAPLPQALIY